MDAVHIHLLLTHFPIVGIIIGMTILGYGQLTKNESIIKVALVTFIVMGLLTIPVFLTGEEAEESVEHLAGISENLIEAHEEFAEKAIWLMGVLGALSLLTLYAMLKSLSFHKVMIRITFLISLVTIGIFANLGYLGGQIRHTEIRATTSGFQGENTKAIYRKHDYDDN